MPLRLHLTPADLTRVRLVPATLITETTASLILLNGRASTAGLRRWRTSVRSSLGSRLSMLLLLARLGGPWLKLLTPQPESGDPGAAIDHLRSAATLTLENDHAAAAELPSWANRLAEGDRRAFAQLADTYAAYVRIAIDPLRRRIQEAHNREMAMRRRVLADGGVELFLSTLHPAARWRPPTLCTSAGVDRVHRLSGEGLSVTSTLFFPGGVQARLCYSSPWLFYSAAASPSHFDGGRQDGPDGPVAALIGRTRQRILAASLAGTTNAELAALTGVSPAAVSQHTAVLRRAGLLVGVRRRNAVVHTATALGLRLLEAGDEDVRRTRRRDA